MTLLLVGACTPAADAPTTTSSILPAVPTTARPMTSTTAPPPPPPSTSTTTVADEEPSGSTPDPCDLAGPFTLDITNRYLPFAIGQQSVLEGDLGGRHWAVQITVLDTTRVVAGVETLVFEERESVDDQLIEVSRNYVAQAADGSVCYFGEEVDDYEGGELVGHVGAWLAGEDGALPGILMPPDPRPGTYHQQERAPGVAEDGALVLSVGEAFETPAGTFEDTLVTEDVNPLGRTRDRKRYASGVGLIVDEFMVLTSHEP